jgi:hypothetical protein
MALAKAVMLIHRLGEFDVSACQLNRASRYLLVRSLFYAISRLGDGVPTIYPWTSGRAGTIRFPSRCGDSFQIYCRRIQIFK